MHTEILKGRPRRSDKTRKRQLVDAQRVFREEQRRKGLRSVQLFLTTELVQAIDTIVIASRDSPKKAKTRSELIEPVLVQKFLKKVSSK